VLKTGSPAVVFHGSIVVSLTCTAYLWAAMGGILLTITMLLFVAYAALIIFYALAWQQAREYRKTADDNPALPSKIQTSTFFTIIIPARNEARHIRACLDAVCNQQYPRNQFEVIVIDDHSTDETASLVENYQAPNLRLIRLAAELQETTGAYKKKAIETGIKHAKGEVIITTDADCTAPPEWLDTIAAFYAEHKPALIAMPVALKTPATPIAIFDTLDFMTLQGITAASVNKRMHSMCNGANLAYTKEAFAAVNGFKDIDQIASGDDMLLMHKIAQRFPGKVKYLLSKKVLVSTFPNNSLSDFLRQRIRWASKADSYNDKRIFLVLLLVYLFNAMMLVLLAYGIFANREWPMVNGQWSILNQFHSTFIIQHSTLSYWLMLLLAKTAIELVFLFPVARFFGQQGLLWWFLPAQTFHIVYTVSAGLLGKMGRYEWKGRRVR